MISGKELMKIVSIVGMIASLFGFWRKESSPDAKNGAEGAPTAGPFLRDMMLTTPYAELSIAPSEEYPRVYGVLMDWCVDEYVVTVVSLCDGNASLYTTSSFGIIGGVGHESVREAAKRFVSLAEAYCDQSLPTEEYPYPQRGTIRFYLLTFDGVRVIDVNEASLASGQNRLSGLGDAAQVVISELHMIQGQAR